MMINNLSFILFLLFIGCSTNTESQINQRKIEYLKAFAKVYGYVKYFHPSDEASTIDWNAFSIYGAEQVKKCKSDDELLTELNALFLPIAPSIRFTQDPVASKYDLLTITPKKLEGYQPTFWQHFGVSVGMQSDFYPSNPYKSVRVNGSIKHGHAHETNKPIISIGTTKSIGQPIFDYTPNFGELIEKPITSSIYCQIPLVLYSGERGTFPIVDSSKLSHLIKQLEGGIKEPSNESPSVSWDRDQNIYNYPNQESFRLGNVINIYNVFQHFFPYMEVVDVNWDQELGKALSKSLTDKTGKDHLFTLQKFMSRLQDGHINVNFKGNTSSYFPGITWEWIEGKLVITDVQDSKIPIAKGNVVTHIDGITVKDYFKEVNSRISAGTTGYLNHRAQYASLGGEKGSEIVITVNDRKIPLVRNSYTFSTARPTPYFKMINDSVVYLNINKISMDSINSLLPELEKAKSIICDLRYYPNKNHEFLSHLLKENDTTTSWMQIPKIVYPDQEHLIGYGNLSWNLTAKKPYLGDKKIIFITQGSAISYAESYMGYVQGYDLATIIGQPTAGTNGNINPFEVSGGYQISWTGMKVVKHNGSQLFGIGFIPDIIVHKTIKGIKEERDEFLEKAIEIANY